MNTTRAMTWMGAAVMMVAADAACAQSAGTDEKKTQTTAMPMPSMSPKRVRAVRKSMVDLEVMAKDRRPGQVMPGDPSPTGTAAMKVPMGDSGAPAGTPTIADKPVTAASLEENANKPQIRLPDTAPYNKPVLKPVGDSAARPEVLNGTMPAPVEVVETTAVESAATAAAAPVVERAATGSAVAAVVAAPEAASHEAAATPMVAAPVVEQVQAAPAEMKPMETKIVEPKVADRVIQQTPAVPTTPAAAVAVPVAATPLVDGVVMMQVPSVLSTSGASVRVESISGDVAGVQWRIGNGAWTTPSAGQTADGKVEVRAGLEGQVVLVVDGLAEVRVTRLGRATIERCTESRGATSVGLNVTRGAVEVRPVGAALQEAGKGQMFARVRTPDQTFGLVGPLRVEYDAFSGTKRRSVN